MNIYATLYFHVFKHKLNQSALLPVDRLEDWYLGS